MYVPVCTQITDLVNKILLRIARLVLNRLYVNISLLISFKNVLKDEKNNNTLIIEIIKLHCKR